MQNNWTREETIVAFYVYCHIPFKASNKNNSTIIKYANILGRTPSALNMKVGNIGRLDPNLRGNGIVGLAHGSKLEPELWTEFYANPEKLAFEAETIIANLQQQKGLQPRNADLINLPSGSECLAQVKQRINQSFFRNAVLSSYDYKCCITGIENVELLEACHIVDWSEDETIRTNPQNGLCLSPLFHKAYDELLIAITPDCKVLISDEMFSHTENGNFKDYLLSVNGSKLTMPDRFLPRQDLLQWHYEKYLNR